MSDSRRPARARTLHHRVATALHRLPNLAHGLNLYVAPEKLDLIRRAWREHCPDARSFADLGGVWRVNAGYTRYTLSSLPVRRGVLVDTDIPDPLLRRLRRLSALEIVRGDFASEDVAARVGPVDIVYLFDVLLHQARPHWHEVLATYAPRARCMVIYNQQYVRGADSVRLTDLPLERYMEIASDVREDFYRHVYDHRDEIHPVYGKPWGDIHNLTQWGITDRDLRRVMSDLGYREVYYRNDGSFVGLTALENHAFIFVH